MIVRETNKTRINTAVRLASRSSLAVVVIERECVCVQVRETRNNSKCVQPAAPRTSVALVAAGAAGTGTHSESLLPGEKSAYTPGTARVQPLDPHTHEREQNSTLRDKCACVI